MWIDFVRDSSRSCQQGDTLVQGDSRYNQNQKRDEAWEQGGNSLRRVGSKHYFVQADKIAVGIAECDSLNTGYAHPQV